jgi:hypothetical protein
MSFNFSRFASSIDLARNINRNIQSSNTSDLTTQLGVIADRLTRIKENLPEPYVFISTNNSAGVSTNATAGTLICQSPAMRVGERGQVEDINIIFTTAGGSVDLVKIDGQGNTLEPISTAIGTSNSGIGDVVLQTGQAIGIKVNTLNASGVVQVLCSGKVYKTSEYRY